MKPIFFIDCEFYSDLRCLLLNEAGKKCQTFNVLSSIDKLIFLMNEDSLQKNVAKTMYNMYHRRQNFVPNVI